MGRLPKNGIYKTFPLDANILKSRHRHADTKYRSNVQYLYSKLKEMSENEAAKDSILSFTLLRIQSLEKEIIQKVGSDEMKNYQEDFVNFLLHEEALWKIKDTFKWWRKVEEAFNLHEIVDNEKTDSTDYNRSNCLNLQQKNVTSITEFPHVHSHYSTRKTSHTSGGFSARPTKCRKKLLAYASDATESNNMIPSFSKFNENLFTPCEEGHDSLQSFEEQNCFSTEILAEPVAFENNLF